MSKKWDHTELNNRISLDNEFSPKITQRQWEAYIDVQAGGVTNMWDTRMVSHLSDGELDKDDVLYCIKNYGELSRYFGYNMHNIHGE